MQNNPHDIAALAALGPIPSLSSIIASLSRPPPPVSAERRLLQENALLGAVGGSQNSDLLSILAGSRKPELDNFSAASLFQGHSNDLAQLAAARTLTDVPRDLHLNTDPLLLASAVAAKRQLELANASRRDALMSEAYNRGREEALRSLLRLTGIEGLKKTPVVPQSSGAPGPLSLLTSAAASRASASAPEQEAPTTLTNTDRRKQNNPYFDASNLKDPDPVLLANRRARGGVTEPFPEKLHRMLREVEDSGENIIVSFFPHGRAFAVHNPTRFVSEIMPKYFRQSRLSSFQRQLNLYGFTRISNGPDAGGYYHELFLKGRPNLCVHMRRVGVPQGPAKDVSKAPSNEPDFYSMNPVAATEGKSTGLETR